MTETVAVLSDLHGVLPVLETRPSQPQVAGAAEALQLIRARAEQ